MAASDELITLITGANQGLGYYAVQQLSTTGKHHILLGARSLTKAQDAIEKMRSDEENPCDVSRIGPIEIDVDSDASIAAAAECVREKFGRLDILMPNAGISRAIGVSAEPVPEADPSGPSMREQYQQQYNTNVFGTAVTIDAFLPLLRKSTLEGGKRIAITGSSMASLALAVDPPFEGMVARNYRIYRSTKTALNMVMVSYAEELQAEGFVVSASNPGYCATNLNDHQGFKDPREGAKVLVHVAVAPKEEVHMKLIEEEGVVPW